MSSALNIMAWREILARTMQGFAVETDVSPAWLVNPATNRRLKLDLLYPEVGLAVRFVGLTAKGQPKQSDWEQQEEAQRDQTREELCRQHGVELFLLDADYPHPGEQFQRLRTILSRLSRTLAQGDRPNQDKQTLMPRLAEGARVQHERFGPGVVQSIDPDSGDPKVAILFDSGEQRTFLASLVSDKLQVL